MPEPTVWHLRPEGLVVAAMLLEIRELPGSRFVFPEAEPPLYFVTAGITGLIFSALAMELDDDLELHPDLAAALRRLADSVPTRLARLDAAGIETSVAFLAGDDSVMLVERVGAVEVVAGTEEALLERLQRTVEQLTPQPGGEPEATSTIDSRDWDRLLTRAVRPKRPGLQLAADAAEMLRERGYWTVSLIEFNEERASGMQASWVSGPAGVIAVEPAEGGAATGPDDDATLLELRRGPLEAAAVRSVLAA